MKRYLLKQLRNLTIWLNGYFEEGDLLHFKSNNGKWIYLVILGNHCKDAEKFYQIFPDSKQITQREFDKHYRKGVEIVTVGDEADIDRLNTEDVPTETLKVSRH